MQKFKVVAHPVNVDGSFDHSEYVITWTPESGSPPISVSGRHSELSAVLQRFSEKYPGPELTSDDNLKTFIDKKPSLTVLDKALRPFDWKVLPSRRQASLEQLFKSRAVTQAFFNFTFIGLHRFKDDEPKSRFAEVIKNKFTETPVEVFTADSKFAIGPEDALIIVDMQNDFMDKPSQTKKYPPQQDGVPSDGGAFGVTDGYEIVDTVVDLIKKFKGAGAHVVATLDNHEEKHVSFQGESNVMAGGNGKETKGPFPRHCVYGTGGADLHPDIEAVVNDYAELGNPIPKYWKGMYYETDS